MNENKNITYNKTYLIKKDEDENDILDVKEYFEKEEQFLHPNPKILIGSLSNHFNKVNKKEEDKQNQPLRSSKKVKSRNFRISKLYIKEENSNMKKTGKDLHLLSYNDKNLKLGEPPTKLLNKNKNTINDSKSLSRHIHYKYKSFEDLKKIFTDGMKREKDSKIKGTNNLIPLSTDTNIKRKYISQEKKLKYNSIIQSYSEKYIHNIAKKCKKNESQMLANNIQNYRMRKQIKEYQENNKHLAEKFGDNYWLFSLRRPPKNDFTKINFFNIGTKERPILKSFMDYPDKDVELVNLPYEKYKKNERFYTEIDKDNDNMPKLSEFDDIKIEGKNIVIKEYNDIIDSYKSHDNKIRFKIYKDPKENDKNSVKNLMYKEIYQLRKNKINKKTKIKLKLLKK